MKWKSIRSTRDDRVAAGIRIGLGVLFVMTGIMKVVVPSLGEAFAGQLAGANIPLQELNRWAVPFIEMAVGGALLVGFYTRLATFVVFNIMIVGTYVHLVVDDPSLFPLQPEQPIIPAVVMILSDGYDTSPPEILSAELARLRKRAKSLVWLNPMMGWKGYTPTARGMAAALPHLDLLAPAHNLRSLAALEPYLAAL